MSTNAAFVLGVWLVAAAAMHSRVVPGSLMALAVLFACAVSIGMML